MLHFSNDLGMLELSLVFILEKNGRPAHSQNDTVHIWKSKAHFKNIKYIRKIAWSTRNQHGIELKMSIIYTNNYVIKQFLIFSICYSVTQ